MGRLDRRYLGQVPHQQVVDAMDRLPACGPAAMPQELDVEVAFVAWFRITFRPASQAPKGLPMSWFWIPSFAERL
jgi:hypothetical protein